MVDSAHRGSDVLVIGGGIHGLSTAFHLALAGVRVTVLEAEYCGRHASGLNAGGVRTLGRKVEEIPLSLASREQWHSLADLLGDDGGFVPCGQLKLAETDAELEECRVRVQAVESLGFDHEVLVNSEQVREIVPTVARHIVGGIWVKDDGYALPFRTVMAFRNAVEKLGVKVMENTPALQISPVGHCWHVTTPTGMYQADHLVVAAGAWAGQMAEQLGESVPVRTEGLMLMVTHRAAPFCGTVLSATGRPLSFKQFANGTVVIGGALVGSVDFANRHGEVDMHRLSTSAATVTELFPHVRHLGVNRVWAGIEAYVTDGLPVIGGSRVASNLSYSFGFCSSGFQMGPGVGKRLAQHILGEPSPIDLMPFSINRFESTRSNPAIT